MQIGFIPLVLLFLAAACSDTGDAGDASSGADSAVATTSARTVADSASTQPAGVKQARPESSKPGPVTNPRVLQLMQSDLRNLLIAQEAHFAMEMRYVGPLADVNKAEALQYQTADEVTVQIVEASENGWSGIARSDRLPGRGCAVFVGAVAPPTTPGGRLATREAVPECDE